MSFKLTYSTMFNPPPEMHDRFERALDEVMAGIGASQAAFIDGRDVAAAGSAQHPSPIDRRLVLGGFPAADAADAGRAMEAAHRAFPAWRRTPPAERMALLRRVAGLI